MGVCVGAIVGCGGLLESFDDLGWLLVCGLGVGLGALWK